MICVLWTTVALLAIAFQSFLVSEYEVAGARPDFVVALFATLALRETRSSVTIAAIVAGIFLDALTIDPAGVHTAALALVLLIVGQGQRGGLAVDAWARGVLLAVAITVSMTARPLLVWLFAGLEPAFATLPLSVILTSIYAWALVGVLAWLLPMGLTGSRVGGARMRFR